MQKEFYNDVIESKIEKNIQILYYINYSFINKIENIDQKEKEFLINNFGQNLYYYQLFMKWKKKHHKNNYEEFVIEIMKNTKDELLKEFTFKDEGKTFYRYILSNILNKKICDEKFIKKINFDYFYIEKIKDKKYILKTFPFVEEILKKNAETSLNSLLYNEYFLNCEEFVRGIIEDICKDEIKIIYKKKRK